MTETIYTNRDNTFELLLKADGVAVNLATAEPTKIEILFLGNYYNSDEFPNAFDWTTQGASGIISFDLASITTLEAGRDKNAELIVYDGTNPDGIVWGTFDLLVKELEGTLVEAP